MRKKSSFTFGSKKAKKYIYFFSVFYLLYVVSFCLFLIFPQRFYFRPWEYFKELAFKAPVKQVWDGPELGGYSRLYIYSFQQGRNTLVSCDEFGFRTTPYPAEQYPILFSGASNTWGDTLSDSETIPWIVSKKLQLPILNGAMRPEIPDKLPENLAKILTFHRLRDVKIIVELIEEKGLKKPENFSLNFTQEEFVPRAANRSYWSFLHVHPRRFFFPLKVLRFLRLNCIRYELERDLFDDFHVFRKDPHPYFGKKSQIKKSIEAIEQRSRDLEKRGYIYIFCILPAKESLLGSTFRTDLLGMAKSLNVFFKDKGVHYVDVLQSSFVAKDRYKYFLPNDDHLSEEAAKSIAESIASYISANFDLQTMQPFVKEPVSSLLSLYDEKDLFWNWVD